MRSIFLIIFSFAFFVQVSADCPWTFGLKIFPSKNALYENSRIMIQGDQAFFEYLVQIGTNHSVYLENGHHQVELIIEEICRTEASYIQVFLKPKTTLKIKSIYSLKMELPENLKEVARVRGMNNMMQRSLEWTVFKRKNSRPKFKKIPALKEKTYTPYGCGPEKYAVFNYKLKEQNEVLFFTELIEIETGYTQLAYIHGKDNKIKVGHSMCEGTFRYSCRNKKYKIRFRILDAAGNYSKEWTDWIQFQEPSYIQ